MAMTQFPTSTIVESSTGGPPDDPMRLVEELDATEPRGEFLKKLGLKREKAEERDVTDVWEGVEMREGVLPPPAR